MPPTRLLLPLLVLLGALLAPAAASALTAFRSPSGNIGCYIDRAFARCDVRDHDWQAPPKPAGCKLDWGNGATVSRRARRGRIVCAGDTALNDGRRLGYGRTIRRGGLRCRSSEAGIRCANARGHGFSVSKQRYRLF